MKNFTQKFIRFLALVFAMSFTVNSQEIGDIYEDGYIFQINDNGTVLIANLQDLGQIDWWSATGVSEWEPMEGYDDWYLPNVAELELMYNTIGQGAENIGGFSNGWYWSSTFEGFNASMVNFGNGATSSFNKSQWNWIRVIRSVTYELEVPGCTDATAFNYNSEANTDDGSCVEVVEGCMDETAFNYNAEANTQTIPSIGDLYKGGILFYVDMNDSTGLVSAIEDVDGLFEWGCYGTNLIEATNYSIGSGFQNTMAIVNANCTTENGGITAAQAALDFESNGENDWYLPSRDELKEMYNTIGYGGSDNVGEFENAWYYSSSQPNGAASYDNAYRVTFSFNGNGFVQALQKYWEYNVRPIRSVNLDNGCIAIVNGCTDVTAFNYNAAANTDDGSCIAVVNGCIDATAFNYNSDANTDDGSCVAVVEGCMDETAFNYNAEANTIQTYEIGDSFQEGKLFYIDEDNQSGIIVATQPLGIYPWGCLGINLSGAQGSSIGHGLQNSIDIISQCEETPIAASEAMSYEIGQYNDWYLPSRQELSSVFNNLVVPGLHTFDLSGSNGGHFWSSTENGSEEAYCMTFLEGSYYGGVWGDCGKQNARNVLAVRNVIIDDGCIAIVNGCTDSTAFNYNSEANTDDGSCVAVVEGCIDATAFNYNAEANTDDGSCVEVVNGCMDATAFNYNPDANMSIIPAIGDIYQGGYLFQINEDGTGLVAATEDLGQFEWGCFGTSISGADGQSIGTGYQNTLDIVAGCSETPIAASEALAYESQGYSDWYLPSKDELIEMYNTIGKGGPDGNIGVFEEGWYWSSSESASIYAWYISFVNGYAGGDGGKLGAGRVRVIRSVTFDVECVAVVEGCVDETAFNYDVDANTDDGSCIATVYWVYR